MKKNEFDRLEKEYRRVQADVSPARAAYIKALQASVPKTPLIQRLQETTSSSFQERLVNSCINQAVDTPTLSAVNPSEWLPEVERSACSLPEALFSSSHDFEVRGFAPCSGDQKNIYSQ